MEFNGNELTHNYRNLQNELLKKARKVSTFHEIPITELTVWHYIKYFQHSKGLLFARKEIPRWLNELSGEIVKSDGLIILATNEVLNDIDEAHVIGHELGHLVEHFDSNRSKQSFAGLLENKGYHPRQYIEEFEANQIALMILVNDWALLNALAHKHTFVSITQQFLKRK